VADNDASIEDRMDDPEAVGERRETIDDEIENDRTRIDRIEREVVEPVNDQMDTVLERLDFEDLDRMWLERLATDAREARQTVERTRFELHVVRSIASGATYEDTVYNLSEREVTGLVFAFAGYLTHDVHEVLQFVLLDGVEAINAGYLSRLVHYLADYAAYLVVAMLPEDADALDEDYEWIKEFYRVRADWSSP